MKPYVVIIKQMKDNKIILTEAELKSMIERAYNDGYNDGYSKNCWWYNNTPTITYCGSATNITPEDPFRKVEVWCSNNTTGEIGDNYV